MPKPSRTPEALSVEWWPASKPVPYEANPRVISEAAIDKVALSIGEYGWRQPIVVDEAGVVIAGHTRLRAAQKLGRETVPVHVARGLSAAQVKGLRLMDNRSAEESGWDDGLLVAELDELLALDFDLAYAGFEEDLDEVLGSGEALGLAGHGADDGEELPAAEAFPVSRPGDLWVCGPHRVLCGNATVDDDVAKLLGSETAAMCFTDPPFNVTGSPSSSVTAPTRSCGEPSATSAGEARRRQSATACRPSSRSLRALRRAANQRQSRPKTRRTPAPLERPGA